MWIYEHEIPVCYPRLAAGIVWGNLLMLDDVDRQLVGWSKRSKMLLTIAGGITAAMTFVAAYADLTPATRGWTKQLVAETVSEKIRAVEARLERSETRGTATQFQVNSIRRDSLERERFDLTLKLKTEKEPSTQQLIEQRLRQINDDLADVVNERNRIRFPVAN